MAATGGLVDAGQQVLRQGRTGDADASAVVGVGAGDVPALAGVGQLQGAALLGRRVTDAAAAAAAVEVVACATFAVGLAAVAVGGDVDSAEAEASLTGLLPPQTGTGAEQLAVSARSTVVVPQLEDLVAGVDAGLDGQAVILTHLATDHGGEAGADRELVVQTVDGDDVATITAGAAILLEARIQIGQRGDGIPAGEPAVGEVAGPQGGAQQVLAGEAGVEVQANVVVERDGVTQLVVFVR